MSRPAKATILKAEGACPPPKEVRPLGWWADKIEHLLIVELLNDVWVGGSARNSSAAEVWAEQLCGMGREPTRACFGQLGGMLEAQLLISDEEWLRWEREWLGG